jgi:hypothetical protein
MWEFKQAARGQKAPNLVPVDARLDLIELKCVTAANEPTIDP